MDELKPCPFCGSSNVRYISLGENTHFCTCDNCDTETRVRSSLPRAIADWNTRPTEQKLKSDIMRLIEGLDTDATEEAKDHVISEIISVVQNDTP